MRIMLICQKCGKGFEARSADGKRCRACAKKREVEGRSKTRVVRCLDCGTEMVVTYQRLYCKACAKRRHDETKQKPRPEEGETPCVTCLLHQNCSLLIVGKGKSREIEERWAFSDDPYCWPSSAQHQVWLDYQSKQNAMAVTYEPALQVA